MLNDYVSLLIYLVVALLVALAISFASQILGPHAPGGLKRTAYESGIVSPNPIRTFSVRFYRVAMLFMIFDVAVMSLYPWAVSLRQLGQAGALRGLVMLAVLAVAFAYLWNKGGFRWD